MLQYISYLWEKYTGNNTTETPVDGSGTNYQARLKPYFKEFKDKPQKEKTEFAATWALP